MGLSLCITGTLPLYLKIFLDSPIGQMLIKSFQRGTTIMNINPNDIGEMEIPLLPMERQQTFARQFLEKQERYRREKAELEQRWDKERTELYDNFVGGSEDGGEQQRRNAGI